MTVRDVAVVEILQAVHRRRIDPAGSGRSHHDKHGSFEAADALQLFEGKPRARLRRLCRSQPDIDPDRLAGRPFPRTPASRRWWGQRR